MSVSIAIDLGGTNIKVGLLKNEALQSSTSIKAVSANSISDSLPALKDSINRMLSENQIPKDQIAGIGIAFPSIVDSVNNRILSKYVKYSDAQDLDLNVWVKNEWDCLLALENDARAALVGEWQYGAGKGCSNLVLVTLGTGMGSAAIVEGQLLRGKHFMAGNLGGHMTINFDGRICNCGNIGCVESEGSTWVLPDLIKDDPGYESSQLSGLENPDFEQLFKLSKIDDLAGKIKENCMKAWAFGLINLVHAFDPEKIVIGGGIMRAKDEVLPFFQSKIDNHTWGEKGSVECVVAQQVDNAGILGMGYLVDQAKKGNHEI